jgi:hypothetical protein
MQLNEQQSTTTDVDASRTAERTVDLRVDDDSVSARELIERVLARRDAYRAQRAETRRQIEILFRQMGLD